MDADERNCNIIITGLSEKDVVQEESVYKTDPEKVNEILNKLNLPLLKGNKCLRLGKPSANYNRVLKVNVISKGNRDSILEKSKSLKDMGAMVPGIFKKGSPSCNCARKQKIK